MGTELIIDEGLRCAIRAAFALQAFPCGTSEAVGYHPPGFDVTTGDTIGRGIGSWVFLFVRTAICASVALAKFRASVRAKLLVQPVSCGATISSERP